MKREVDEIECWGKGSLFHVRWGCIDKDLSWGDERLMRTLVWSLKLFNWESCSDFISYSGSNSGSHGSVLNGNILCLEYLDRLKMKRIESF